MTSINSSSNFLAVFKNNFRRYVALFAVFQTFALLLSVLFISFNSGYFDDADDISKTITDAFSNNSLVLFAAFCSVEAFIFVAVMFREIYSKRASNYYFSLPVKRGTWFNANFLFGAVNFAVSYAIFYICSVLAVNSGIFKQFRYVNLEAGTFLKYTSMSFAAVIVLLAVFSMCAVVSGRMWQYILLCFISSAVIYIGTAGLICYINTIYGFWVNLSEAYTISALALVFSDATEISVWKFFAFAAVQFAVFYASGYLSFKKRKAEVAENKLSGKALPIVLTAVCLFAEVFACLGIGNEISLSARIIAAIITVAVTAVFLSAIFFRKAISKPVLASFFCAALISVTVIISVQFISEKTYVNAVPETEEIGTVSIYDYGNFGSSSITDLLYGINYLDIPDECRDKKYEFLTGEAKEKAVEFHKKLISDETRKNNYLSSYYENGTSILGIEYKLKNGKSIKRVYEVATKCIVEEGIALFKTDEGINKLDVFDFDPDDVTFSVFRLCTDDYAEPFYIEDTDFHNLVDCVKKDLKNRETDGFLSSAGIPCLTMWEEYVPDPDDEPKEDLYAVSFYTFKDSVSASARTEIEKLSPKEILMHNSEYDLQIDYYNNQWVEESGTYIYKEDINTVSYLEKLGYKF